MAGCDFNGDAEITLKTPWDQYPTMTDEQIAMAHYYLLLLWGARRD